MPDLDYAFLADYVRPERGLAHVMATGIDTVTAPSVPTGYNLGLVARSKHARLQMEKRAISEQDVEMACRNRIGEPRPGQPGTIWIWGLAVGGRTPKVCVPMADQELVITAAWPDQHG